MVGTDFNLKMRAKIRGDVGKRVLLRGKKHQKEAMPPPQFFLKKAWGTTGNKHAFFYLFTFSFFFRYFNFPPKSGFRSRK